MLLAIIRRVTTQDKDMQMTLFFVLEKQTSVDTTQKLYKKDLKLSSAAHVSGSFLAFTVEKPARLYIQLHLSI